MYARGMSVRDMQALLLELYEVDVSEALISSVTNTVLDDVRAWQSRPLDRVYPIVYFDGIVVKSGQDGKVSNRAVSSGIGTGRTLCRFSPIRNKSGR